MLESTREVKASMQVPSPAPVTRRPARVTKGLCLGDEIFEVIFASGVDEWKL